MTERPGYGPDRVVRGLTLRRRVGTVLAGLGGLAGALLIGTLWVTEPGELPVRTQVAFAALILTGTAWAVGATVTLTRGPLFAIDRVVAGWLAVTFSALLTVGIVAIALTRAGVTGVVAASSIGLTLLVAAGATLVRARSYRASLLVRMRELHNPTPGGPHTMNARRPAPIGPLAIALRHLRSPIRRPSCRTRVSARHRPSRRYRIAAHPLIKRACHLQRHAVVATPRVMATPLPRPPPYPAVSVEQVDGDKDRGERDDAGGHQRGAMTGCWQLPGTDRPAGRAEPRKADHPADAAERQQPHTYGLQDRPVTGELGEGHPTGHQTSARCVATRAGCARWPAGNARRCPDVPARHRWLSSGPPSIHCFACQFTVSSTGLSGMARPAGSGWPRRPRMRNAIAAVKMMIEVQTLRRRPRIRLA